MQKEFLKNKFQMMNISLTDHQADQFLLFYQKMIEVNQVMNLTGITEFEEVVQKHFMDSVYGISPYINVPFVLDVGTGAGFPGIPLKIVYPNIQITLLDSLKKRLNFLDDVICDLQLTSVSTLHGRAEDYGKATEYRERFDLVVSRAVANLASLSEYCLPFVSVGGYFLSYKSGNIADEMNASKQAITTLGGTIEDIKQFRLPDSDISRTLVVIHKVKNTPKKFPRKAGIPTKEPLY